MSNEHHESARWARRAERCTLSADALVLCDESELRYEGAARSEAAGFPAQADQLRLDARRITEVHLAEGALRDQSTR
jgi:hypothetical protein